MCCFDLRVFISFVRHLSSQLHLHAALFGCGSVHRCCAQSPALPRDRCASAWLGEVRPRGSIDAFSHAEGLFQGCWPPGERSHAVCVR